MLKKLILLLIMGLISISTAFAQQKIDFKVGDLRDGKEDNIAIVNPDERGCCAQKTADNPNDLICDIYTGDNCPAGSKGFTVKRKVGDKEVTILPREVHKK